MRRSSRHAGGWTIAAAALVSMSAAAQAPDLAATLARIGGRVEQYYARARSLVCTETVRLQPLSTSFSFEGPGRELVYEARIEWEPPSDGEAPGEAVVTRELVKVNGRAPRAKDQPGCTDPKPLSPEPLALLLPARREEYAFTWAGTTRVDGRPSVRLDYKGVVKKPPQIVWKGDCVTIDLPGRARGRIWVDAATDDILRLDEHLVGQFEVPTPREHRWSDASWIVLERADSSIRYRPVVFHDPDETIVVPASIDTMVVAHNVREPRLRTTQTFSECKRFITRGRVVRE